MTTNEDMEAAQAIDLENLQRLYESVADDETWSLFEQFKALYDFKWAPQR